MIDRLIPGGGAEAAGLAAGDRVMAVDGVAVKQLGMDDAIQRIRGVEGSSVRLTINRASAAPSTSPVDLVVVRRKIAL